MEVHSPSNTKKNRVYIFYVYCRNGTNEVIVDISHDQSLASHLYQQSIVDTRRGGSELGSNQKKHGVPSTWNRD